jgi:hypothetical protein
MSGVKINVNTVLLYPEETILTCPVCMTDHYEVVQDMYYGDHLHSGQVKRVSDAIEDPAVKVSNWCQKCPQRVNLTDKLW